MDFHSILFENFLNIIQQKWHTIWVENKNEKQICIYICIEYTGMTT